jgi:alcohol dehydrogenase YqhD (iron-dependent ADH family)
MKPFEYFNPTRLIMGADELTMGDIISSDGHKKVLLVYGKNSIKSSGLYDALMKRLKRAGLQVIEHGGVSSNPVLTHAREGALRAQDCDAVLAVGGGSCIDEAKAIAAAVGSGCDVWDLYEGHEVTAALPLYVILTLSATGSEMNDGSVLTNEERREKLSFGSELVYPRVSIINPALTYSLPMDYLAYSAVDAITHVLEGYFTSQEHPLIIDRLIENIVKTIIETTDRIIQEPQNLDARSEFALACTWALNGLTGLGVGGYAFPNHMIEHSLSALYNVPHGAGLSVVLPAWMKWRYAKSKSAQFERFAREVFGLDSGDEGIAALETWFGKIGAPTKLSELDIKPQAIDDLAKNTISMHYSQAAKQITGAIKSFDIDKIVTNVTSVAHKWGLHKEYTKNVVKEILELAC